jgi:hypothetical protein
LNAFYLDHIWHRTRSEPARRGVVVAALNLEEIRAGQRVEHDVAQPEILEDEQLIAYVDQRRGLERLQDGVTVDAKCP